VGKLQYIEKKFAQPTLDLIEVANAIIEEYAGQGFDLTLRQLFYQFVSRGYIANTEASYKRVGDVMSDARRAGLIDWFAIVDRTRFVRSLSHWNDARAVMISALKGFHTDKWKAQPCRPEVWIEKDALVGVIQGVCQKWDVPYFSCRGYVSDSEMWRASMRFYSRKSNGQNPVVIHLGDHDPSGLDMTRDIEDRLRLFTFGQIGDVRRVALNYDQVELYNPPPNPAKLTDSRCQEYIAEHGEYSWELDALSPPVLAKIIEDTILSLLDQEKWAEAVAVEDRYKAQLSSAIDRWEEIAGDGGERES